MALKSYTPKPVETRASVLECGVFTPLWFLPFAIDVVFIGEFQGVWSALDDAEQLRDL